MTSPFAYKEFDDTLVFSQTTLSNYSWVLGANNVT
jgi:hypothetical protein